MSSIPLSMLRAGDKAEIVEFHCKAKLRNRLTEMGLTCGDCIHVISGGCEGPMILGTKQDARLAIGQGMAHQIMVALTL